MPLIIVSDPEAGFTTLVNPEAFTGTGPAVPGPQGAQLLEQWVRETDYDLAQLDTDALRTLFQQWLQRNGQLDTDTPQDEPQPPGAPESDPDGSEAALADHEAQNGGDEPPPPQPADTDPDAASEPRTVPRACPNCNGAGTVTHRPEDGPEQTVECGFCQGTGQIKTVA